MEQTQICGGIKPVIGISSILLLIIRSPTAIQIYTKDNLLPREHETSTSLVLNVAMVILTKPGANPRRIGDRFV
jgi:hypothetical protein